MSGYRVQVINVRITGRGSQNDTSFMIGAVELRITSPPNGTTDISVPFERARSLDAAAREALAAMVRWGHGVADAARDEAGRD